MSVKVSNSITYRLARNTIVMTILLGGLYIGTQLAFDLNSEKRYIEQSTLETASMFIPQARQALYNFNSELADAVADSIFQNPALFQVRLLDAEYGLVAKKEREPLTGKFSGLVIWLFGENRTFTLPIHQHRVGAEIGLLEISVDQYYVAKQFLDRFFRAVLFGVAYTVLLSAMFLVVFNLSVSRPLKAMVVWLSKVKPERPDLYRFEYSRRVDDEFELLANTVYTLLSGLGRSIRNSRVVEAELNHHKDNLEKMVQARTVELSESNRKFVHERFQAKLSAMAAQQARWDAEKATQDKTRFLAAASHDLRQPLHAMALFVEALEPHINDDHGREIHNNLRDSLNTMKQLFNALLDLSKLEAGVLTPQVEDFPLQDLFRRLEMVYQTQAEEKGLWLRIRKTEVLVKSDPHLLEQIVANLLANAIKYTETGGVLVCCRRRDDELFIEVRDTGIGIKQEDQQRIFGEFVQLHNPERDRSKGLGLGMAIVKRTSDLLGHKVSVKSKPNKGSLFVVQVPEGEARSVEEPLAVTIQQPIEGKRVLVLDDDPAVLLGMKSVLESWQLQPMIVQTLDDAISLLASSQQMPDLIISDLSLAEDLNGIEAIGQLQHYLKRNIPSILITGENTPEGIRLAHDTPYPLLYKPIKPAQLRTVCRSILKAEGPRQ